MTVTLVIPAFNEERRLRPFLERIAAFVQAHPTQLHEILVVDDGSTDRTAKTAREFTGQLPQLRVISHPTNRGKGAAVQTGVLAADGDLIIFMDADGATDIAELPKMIAALEKNDVAVGNRWLKESRTQRSSWFRHIAGATYRRYMQLFGIGEVDTMCGFKGYHRAVARALFAHLLEERWLFDAEIAYKAHRAGYRIANFPIQWQSVEGSKLSALTLLKTAWQILPLMRRINRQLAQQHPPGDHSLQ